MTLFPACRTKSPKPPKPRTRAKRVLAALGGFAIVLALLGTIFAYTGTPLGRELARRSAVDYANETYPGNDFQVVGVNNRHWFCYEVWLQSQTSQDTCFFVEVVAGYVISDDNEQWVASNRNTRDRIINALSMDVDHALADTEGFDSFSLYLGEVPQMGGSQPIPTEGHPPLTLDMPYDKANLPPAALVLRMKRDTLPADAAEQAQLLMARAKSAMDAAGIDLAAYRVVIETLEGHALYSSSVTAAADVEPAVTAAP